jgi:hypothetical protein
MDEFETVRCEGASTDFGRLSCEIVLLGDRQPDRAGSYLVTCTDTETGRFIGSTLLPADPDGGPPSVTLGDLVGLIGGAYRLASVFVEIEAERLARRTRRLSDRLRHRDRRWLRRARRSVPYESALEADFAGTVSP